jgi:hypothetical protein
VLSERDASAVTKCGLPANAAWLPSNRVSDDYGDTNSFHGEVSYSASRRHRLRRRDRQGRSASFREAEVVTDTAPAV